MYRYFTKSSPVPTYFTVRSECLPRDPKIIVTPLINSTVYYHCYGLGIACVSLLNVSVKALFCPVLYERHLPCYLRMFCTAVNYWNKWVKMTMTNSVKTCYCIFISAKINVGPVAMHCTLFTLCWVIVYILFFCWTFVHVKMKSFLRQRVVFW